MMIEMWLIVGAKTSLAETLVDIILFVVVLGFGVICAMKDKWAFFVLGFFTGIFWIVGAIRLAKPGSHWAKRRYRADKMAMAEERFPRSV